MSIGENSMNEASGHAHLGRCRDLHPRFLGPAEPWPILLVRQKELVTCEGRSMGTWGTSIFHRSQCEFEPVP